MVTNTMRGLSPVHNPRPSKPANPPQPPASNDRAELGSKVAGGVTFASLAGLCLMAGTSVVHAQVATPAQQAAPLDLTQQVAPVENDQEDLTLSEQLTQAAQKQGIALQFEVRPANAPPVSVTPWHAEKILAEAGTVVVTEVKDNQFDRAAYLTDTTDLVSYLHYMQGASAETAQEQGAASLRAFFNLTPNTQIVHPMTQESLSPFTAARMLKAEKPLLLRMDGVPQKQLNNLRELERNVGNDDGPGCNLTGTLGGGKPGVWCLFGN
ncbi:hypothetical protein JST97_27430 [bacterium]|nr:hypothetical protein [bacterium]